MVTAIERAGKSVVAIARVRKGERNVRSPDELRDPLQFDASPFGFLPDANPTSPDFVPNEFASGVVLDREGHIVTNYHVLGDPEQNDYFVWVQRRPFKVAHVEVPAGSEGGRSVDGPGRPEDRRLRSRADAAGRRLHCAKA